MLTKTSARCIVQDYVQQAIKNNIKSLNVMKKHLRHAANVKVVFLNLDVLFFVLTVFNFKDKQQTARLNKNFKRSECQNQRVRFPETTENLFFFFKQGREKTLTIGKSLQDYIGNISSRYVICGSVIIGFVDSCGAVSLIKALQSVRNWTDTNQVRNPGFLC